MSSPVSPVTILGTDQELQRKLADATGKLVVLEFVKQGSQICKYVETERDKMAEDMKDKAEFYELDVDKFKKYAEKFKVEALPAFVVMEKFVKKRHVVGTDDLKTAIEDAYTKFQRKPEANDSASNVDSVPNDGSEAEKPPPTTSNIDYVPKQDTKCSIL